MNTSCTQISVSNIILPWKEPGLLGEKTAYKIGAEITQGIPGIPQGILTFQNVRKC